MSEERVIKNRENVDIIIINRDIAQNEDIFKGEVRKKIKTRDVILLVLFFVVVGTIITGVVLYRNKYPNIIKYSESFHDKNDDYHNMFLNVKEKVKEKGELKHLFFNPDDKGGIDVYLEVEKDNIRYLLEYNIVGQVTDDLFKNMEIVNAYEFDNLVKQNYMFLTTDVQVIKWLTSLDNFLLFEEVYDANFILTSWRKENKFSYYRFEEDKNGKCQKIIFGGFLQLVVKNSKKARYIKYEFSTEDFLEYSFKEDEHMEDYYQNFYYRMDELYSTKEFPTNELLRLEEFDYQGCLTAFISLSYDEYMIKINDKKESD